jgi:hypothetical protein
MRVILLAAVCALLGASALAHAEDPPTLQNADVSLWDGDLPTGWSLSEGARTGEGPASKVVRGAEGGVRLEGDATTRVWTMLSQRASLPADATCRLSFEARILGARLDPGQRDNAYVGVRLVGGTSGGAGGRGPRVVLETLTRAAWTPAECVFRVGDAEAHVSAFLSKTGALEVRNVRLETLAPAQAFDVLVSHMSRYYSFLELKGGTWPAHAASLRTRAASVSDEAALVAVLKELLAPLEDIHVSIKRPSGQIEHPYIPSYRPNVEIKALKQALGEITPAGRAGFVARLDGGIGYLASSSLQGAEESHVRLRELLKGLLDAPGLVIDLRGNGGGEERRAQALVGMLIDAPVVYARRKVRSGPLPGDFTPLADAVLQPAPGATRYKGPIVVLLGPGCVSSGEGMAQMLDALPNVRSVGQPTQGASGSPFPVPLPGGLEVSFSRWFNVQMDGTALEGRGVQPDVVVDPKGPGDPTLAAGLAELQRLLKGPK